MCDSSLDWLHAIENRLVVESAVEKIFIPIGYNGISSVLDEMLKILFLSTYAHFDRYTIAALISECCRGGF